VASTRCFTLTWSSLLGKLDRFVNMSCKYGTDLTTSQSLPGIPISRRRLIAPPHTAESSHRLLTADSSPPTPHRPLLDAHSSPPTPHCRLPAADSSLLSLTRYRAPSHPRKRSTPRPFTHVAFVALLLGTQIFIPSPSPSYATAHQYPSPSEPSLRTEPHRVTRDDESSRIGSDTRCAETSPYRRYRRYRPKLTHPSCAPRTSLGQIPRTPLVRAGTPRWTWFGHRYLPRCRSWYRRSVQGGPRRKGRRRSRSARSAILRGCGCQ
jgi:hypothetical protein